MDMVRKLILDRLADKSLSMKDASLKMGRAHSYLYQFLKRGIPLELHERDRQTLSVILDISEDDLRGPSVTLPKRSYEKNVSSRKSIIDDATQPPYPRHESAPLKIVPAAELFGEHIDLPVFGTAQGGQDGALVITDRAVDWVARPTVLLRVQDGYGIIVSGDSMEPVVRAGSTMLVNPHSPPRISDPCIFRCHSDDGTTHVMVKEYRGQTETHWKVRQYNPPKDFTLKKDAWQVCHRTVGSYFA